MAVGPIQFVAITFPAFRPGQGILAALQGAVDAGAIRLVDLQFIRKDQAGKITTMEMSGLSSVEVVELGGVIEGLLSAGAARREGAVEGALFDSMAVVEANYGLGLGDIRAVAERIRPGSAAALMVIEHVWAIEFGDAVRRAGGKVAAQGFLTREAAMVVGEELVAIAEAEMAVELSEAIQVEAAYEAAEAVVFSEAIQAEAARRAAQALVAAQLIEEATLEDVTQVVANSLVPRQGT